MSIVPGLAPIMPLTSRTACQMSHQTHHTVDCRQPDNQILLSIPLLFPAGMASITSAGRVPPPRVTATPDNSLCPSDRHYEMSSHVSSCTGGPSVTSAMAF